MTTHIAKVYKFTQEKFLQFCKEVYVPEEKTVKKCPNNHKNASGKFCKDCGSPLTDEIVLVKQSNNYIMEYVWDELNCNEYFAITNISLKEKEIEFLYSIQGIERIYMSIDDINNTIENSKLEKDEYTDLLEKYCSSFEYGVIDFMY